MSKEEDIGRLETTLRAAPVGTYREIATQIVNAGFGYIGDAEVKKSSDPVELTRKWFEDRYEARSRDELERDIDNWKFHFEASERDRASLRATISDLEKRLKNSVEIPKSEVWPEWANHVWVLYAKRTHEDLLYNQDTIAAIPRPTPAKPTPELMAEAIVGHHVKTSPELGETKDHDAVLADGWAKLARDLLSGKTIEELYKESLNGR